MNSDFMHQTIRESRGGLFIRAMVVLMVLALAGLGGAVFYGSKTVHDLFKNNQKLKAALSNLTHEDQIGYAKVIGQTQKEGRLYTSLKFVETARGNPLQKILEREYTIEGDVVFFDAMIVTFDDRWVMDGTRRAIYLWRRVYGENMPPAQGFPIEMESTAPRRYAPLFAPLGNQEDDMFWDAVWQLADDPDALAEYGIKAVYGNAVYKKLKPGLIYVFKISNTGQVYPEVVPDI